MTEILRGALASDAVVDDARGKNHGKPSRGDALAELEILGEGAADALHPAHCVDRALARGDGRTAPELHPGQQACGEHALPERGVHTGSRGPRPEAAAR